MEYSRKVVYKGQRVSISKRNGVLVLQGATFSQSIERSMIVTVNETRDTTNAVQTLGAAMFLFGLWYLFSQGGWVPLLFVVAGASAVVAVPWNKTTVELVMVRGAKVVIEGGSKDYGQLRDFILS